LLAIKPTSFYLNLAVASAQQVTRKTKQKGYNL